MSRRSLSNILSEREQSLSDVWRWYEFQRSLIGEEKGRVWDVLAAGTTMAISRYVGKTREELDEEFTYQIAELEFVTILGLFACTEAALRIDFIERVRLKKKDAVSVAFWRTYRRRGTDRVRTEEDILDVWRDQDSGRSVRRVISEFKGAFNLRHWLAHGRYWRPKLGRAAGYGPIDVFEICQQLLEAVGLVAPSDR